MLKNIKKGFTIVELVIVIAVIAILAGVLIPTFSSVTKNAKQSAAMQQAKNAMEATLALTGGSYTEGTDFIVNESTDGKIAYWFEYKGNKLNDVTDETNTTAEYVTGDDGYYAAYFSTKCFITGTTEDISNKVGDIEEDADYKQSLATLKEAIGVDKTYTEVLASNGSNGYFTLTFTKTESSDKKIVHIYYTPDIEPTLVIILGTNK